MEFYLIIFTFIISAVVLLLTTPLALKAGLKITPSEERHIHNGTITLNGGLIIYLALFITVFFYSPLNSVEQISLIFAATLLFVTGLLDDIRPLKPNYRFFSHILTASIVVVQLDLSISHLGLIYSEYPFQLGDWDTFFTIFAVVGLINAFNMIDGLNGLSSGMAIISLSFLATYTPMSSEFLTILITAVITFMLFNLKIFGKNRQVFLGDSGSTLLGLIIAWFALESFHGDLSYQQVSPIGILMMFALPVIDTLAVMIRRAINGYSIFIADKKHLHHILLLFNRNEYLILNWLLWISIGFALLGKFQHQLGLTDTFLFNLCLIATAVHFWLLKLAQKRLIGTKKTQSLT